MRDDARAPAAAGSRPADRGARSWNRRSGAGKPRSWKDPSGADRRARRQASARGRRGGLGHQDLPAVRAGADAGGLVHGERHVSAALRGRPRPCAGRCAPGRPRRPARRGRPAPADRPAPRRRRPRRRRRRAAARRPRSRPRARRAGRPPPGAAGGARRAAARSRCPSRWNSRVDPSMSDMRKVTVPAGSAPCRRRWHGCAPRRQRYARRRARRGVARLAELPRPPAAPAAPGRPPPCRSARPAGRRPGPAGAVSVSSSIRSAASATEVPGCTDGRPAAGAAG